MSSIYHLFHLLLCCTDWLYILNEVNEVITGQLATRVRLTLLLEKLIALGFITCIRLHIDILHKYIKLDYVQQVLVHSTLLKPEHLVRFTLWL